MNLAIHARSPFTLETTDARKTALVLDARHTGCAIATHLAERDFAVAIGYRPHDAGIATETAAVLVRAGGRAIAVPVGEGEAGIAHLFECAEHVFGRVDVLIDNGRGELASHSAEDELFDRYFGAALRGMVDGVRVAAPRLRSGGSIVHLSDARTDNPMRTLAWMTPQAALEWLLRTFAGELARYDVRVNAIAPSIDCDDDAIADAVADAVALLAGEDGDGCNGQVFDVGALACHAIGASP